jgi:ESX secretion system ATPase EccB
VAGRREQLHGYRFLSRRNAGALLHADSDAAEGPLRRLSGGTIASVAVGLLVAVVAGIFGLLRPGSGSSWQHGKSLIIEAGTGTRYVYLGGVLHPVQNYASALLILRSGAVSPVTVSQAAIDRVKQGPPVGIPSAPDSIPAVGSLLAGPWTVCSAPGSDSAGAPYPIVDVAIGRPPAGRPLAAASAVLVSAAGSEYLVWNGTRLRIASYVPNALGYASTTPLEVGNAWLNAIPQGPDLAAPEPPGIGSPGPEAGGTRTVVGRVYVVGSSYYTAYSDGLAPITAVQERLMLADPLTARAYRGAPPVPLPLSVSAAAAASVSASRPAQTAGLPAGVPALASAGGQPGGPGSSAEICASLASAAADTVNISIFAAPSQTVTGSPSQPVDAGGDPIANNVVVPDGRAALVRAVPNPGVSSGTLYLVTELGIKYPLASNAVLSDLGLASATPAQVPENIVALLPTGPTLDETAALQVAPVGPGS